MTYPIWTWTRDIGSQSVHNQSLTSQEKTDINIGSNKTRHDTSHHGNVFHITVPLWESIGEQRFLLTTEQLCKVLMFFISWRGTGWCSCGVTVMEIFIQVDSITGVQQTTHKQFWSRINASHRITRELGKYRRKSPLCTSRCVRSEWVSD